MKSICTYLTALCFSLYLISTSSAESPDRYEEAVSVAQKSDFKQARSLFEILAKEGDYKAQVILGTLYANGLGGSVDFKLANKWFKLSAEKGHRVAQYNMGQSYFNGWGSRKDYGLAKDWYVKAAEQGHIKSQYNLGFMSVKGLGMPIDLKRAYMWWVIAAAMDGKNMSSTGDKAKKAFFELQTMMSSADIADAGKLVTKCLAQDFQGC